MKTFSIIGMGNISKKHIEAINKNDGKLLHSCDIDPKKYPDYFSYQSLALETSSDYYVIATPHGTHFEIAKYILENNKGKVIIEKPIVTSLEEYKLLLKYKHRIIPILQNRYSEEYINVKKEINTNMELIKEIYINVLWNRPKEYFTESNWRGTSRHSDNILLNQMIHYVDLAINLYDYSFDDLDILYNYKRKSHHYIETFDTIISGVNLNNGITMHFNGSLNMNNKNFRNEIIIITECNNYVIDFNNGNKNEYGTYQGSLSLHNELYRDLIKTGKTNASYENTYPSLYICHELMK